MKRDVFVTGARGVLLATGNGATDLVWTRGNGVKRVVFMAGNGVTCADLLIGEGTQDDGFSFSNCAVGKGLVVGCEGTVGAALLTDDGALSFATTSAADLKGRGGSLAD